MDKQTGYLRAAKNKMLFHFKQEEIVCVLRNLKQFFETGRAEQKTDEELIGELGSPMMAVGRIAADESFRHPFYDREILSVLTAAGALVLLGLLYRFWDIIFFGIPLLRTVAWCLPVIGLPALLWHLSGGSSLYEFAQKTAADKTWNRVLGIVTLPLIAIEQIFILLLALAAGTDVLSAQWSSAVSVMFYMAQGGIFLMALAGIFLAGKVFCGEYLLFPSFICVVGFLTASEFFLCIMRRYSGQGGGIFFMISCVPYIAGLVYSRIWMRGGNDRNNGTDKDI